MQASMLDGKPERVAQQRGARTHWADPTGGTSANKRPLAVIDAAHRPPAATVGDRFEREADRFARSVVDGRRVVANLQHRRPTALSSPTALSVTDAWPVVDPALRSPGRPLDAGARALMEPRLGHDLRHVRIHRGAAAAESARSLSAASYTVGRHIVLADRIPSLGSRPGVTLLAHELAHVVQQGAARPLNAAMVTDVAPVLQRCLATPRTSTDPHRPASSSRAGEADISDPAVADLVRLARGPEPPGPELLLGLRRYVRTGRYAEMAEVISQIVHSRVLTSVLNELGPVEDPVERTISLHVLLRLPTVTMIESSVELFTKKVDEARRKGGATEADLDKLAELRERIWRLGPEPNMRLRELERDIVLWPRRLVGKAEILEVVTGARDLTPAEKARRDRAESKLGRFESSIGEQIKEDLQADSKKFTGDKCLSYLYSKGLARLFAEHEDAIMQVKDAYWAGVRARSKKSLFRKTGSRLFAELHLKGLVGSVRSLVWSGARYEPRPSDLFDELSNGGAGWYFFLVAPGSYHTIAVGVRVMEGGREYFEISNHGSIDRSAKELNDEVDGYGPIYGATTFVWQVYVKSQY